MSEDAVGFGYLLNSFWKLTQQQLVKANCSLTIVEQF